MVDLTEAHVLREAEGPVITQNEGWCPSPGAGLTVTPTLVEDRGRCCPGAQKAPPQEGSDACTA